MRVFMPLEQRTETLTKSFSRLLRELMERKKRIAGICAAPKA